MKGRQVLRAALPASLVLLSGSASALAADTPAANRSDVTAPGVRPTMAWSVVQLVPSPEWLFVDEGTYFGLRWQLTPLLYSFGIDRRLSPWRALVAEPVVRHSGSIELFAAPSYTFLSRRAVSHLSIRAGARAYFPLAHRGEYLSWSIGSTAIHRSPHWSGGMELGIYSMYGVVGVLVEHAPLGDERSTTVTLQLRYF